MARRKLPHPERPVTLYILTSTDDFVMGCIGVIHSTPEEAINALDHDIRLEFGEWVVTHSFPLDPDRRWDYGVVFQRWENI